MTTEAERRHTEEAALEANKMGTAPIGKLLASMAWPAILSMLINALYNVVDSMFVAGRFPQDTLALAMDKFRIGASKGQIRAWAEATTFLATRSYGRLRVPIKFSTGVIFPKDTVPALSLKRLKAEIAGIPLEATADLRFCGTDSLYIKGEASINSCRLSDVLKHVNHCQALFLSPSSDFCHDGDG